MPYSVKNKVAAQDYVDALRARTFCEECGKRPIEWHREEHKKNPHRRVSRLATLGYPIPVIDAEIDLCEALCRSCHMRKDGRLKRLHETAPRQKGEVYILPIDCSNCGTSTKPSWNGMCRRCYDANRRHASTDEYARVPVKGEQP